MDGKGVLKAITRDWKSRRLNLTFEMQEDVSEQVEELQEKVLSITVKPYRKKRSLDANAYYWVLLSKLAKVIGISKNRMHNMMLQRYGQTFIVDGSVIYLPIPDTEEAEDKMLESSTFHLKPTSQVKEGKDGVIYRTYKLLRGSSDYDTQEMAELINGLVMECKDVGIETMPEDEIRRMLDLYDQHCKKIK